MSIQHGMRICLKKKESLLSDAFAASSTEEEEGEDVSALYNK
jgi:hypothetical protein